MAELNDPAQLRLQREVSARSGVKAEVVTGLRTRVSETVQNSMELFVGPSGGANRGPQSPAR